MEEGSSYVKLTKIQDGPVEEIKPGELNQSVKLKFPSCYECGQPLPEDFLFPKDEAWTTGIFGCAEDTESCWTGLFCPCVLFGRNVNNLEGGTTWTHPCIGHAILVEGGIALAAATAIFHCINPILIGEGLLFGWCLCGICTSLSRQSLQKKYHLKNSPCPPCCVHSCMHWCALCQEHREMEAHISESAVVPMTVINPPPVQEMTSSTSQNQDSAQAISLHLNAPP